MAIKTKLIQNASITKKNALKTKLVNKDEEKFKPIITDENGKEIVDDTGVKERVVLRMLKNGRFIAQGLEITYPCQSCGAPITTGKLCSKCSQDILNQAERIKATKSVKKSDHSSRMFNFDRD